MSDLPFEVLGPIPPGTNFIMSTVDRSNKYDSHDVPLVLSYKTDYDGRYYWTSFISTTGAVGPSGASVAVFKTVVADGGITIVDTVNSGYLGWVNNTGEIHFANSASATQLVIDPGPVNPWFPVGTLLGALENGISTTGGDGIHGIIQVANTDIDYPGGNNILFVPMFYSQVNGQCDTPSTNADFLLNWYCGIDPYPDACNGPQFLPSGFTNLSDCMDGNFYSYCNAGQFCGDVGCKGPCEKSWDDCLYRNGEYVCVVNEGRYFREAKWYKSTWFIVVMCGAVLLILVVAVITFLLLKKRAASKNKKS